MLPFLPIFVFWAITATAGEVDAASQEALQKTQTLLKDPALRRGAVEKSPEAQRTEEHMRKMGLSSEQQQRVYETSSQIFEKMVRDSGGDANAMKGSVENAQRDPAAFYESLSPEQRKQIQDLARELEGQKRPSTP